MEPIFTDKQLNNMSREDLISLMKIVQEQTKKKDTEIQLLKDKQKELEFLNAMLSDRLTLAQRKQFGASSEKYAEGYEQMNLFNEAEANADAETEELFEEIRPSSYKCKKRKGKKEEDLSNFETVATRTYKLEGEARYCPACGSMKRPEKEPSLIRGSIATPSLVAGIMNAKYVNGMPLARQEREFARYDLDLSTKTMANWIINCADRYLKPLYQLMKEELLESRYIHCDESRIQVLGEPDQKGTTQNWMWVYLTDEFSGSPQMVLFDYERTRAGYHPVNFLGDRFHGYLTCDGYQAYHSLGEGIIVSGCLTHARRRFDAALTALKKDFTKEQLKETIAYQAMSRIGILYKIEEMIHNKTPEEKYEERQKQSRPVMDALFEWLHTMEDSVDRSSLIGDAILYTLNQEAYLKVFLSDGEVPIDNLASERALRTFTIGRKNWMTINTVRGADASAIIYSVTETARANGLNVYYYIKHLLTELTQVVRADGSIDEKELEPLMPWSKDLPAECYKRRK